MSSYKQLSNQGPPLLSAGASKSRGKRRPISGAISTGHSHRCSGAPFPGAAAGEAAGAGSFYCFRLQNLNVATKKEVVIFFVGFAEI